MLGEMPVVDEAFYLAFCKPRNGASPAPIRPGPALTDRGARVAAFEAIRDRAEKLKGSGSG